MAIFKLVPAGSGFGFPLVAGIVLLFAAPPYFIGGSTAKSIGTTGIVLAVIGLILGLLLIVGGGARIGTGVFFGLLVVGVVWMAGLGARSEVSNGMRPGAVGEWSTAELAEYEDVFDVPPALRYTDGPISEGLEDFLNSAVRREADDAVVAAWYVALVLAAAGIVLRIVDGILARRTPAV